MLISLALPLFVICAAGIGVLNYRKRKASSWTAGQLINFDMVAGIVFVVAICATLGFVLLRSNAELSRANSELAASCRDLWKQVKPLPVGRELTTLGLEQLRVHLKHDEKSTRLALGDEEFEALKEKLALDDLRKQKLAELEKQMSVAQRELDRLSTELKDSTRRLEKLDEIQPAMKAFQEGRRLAPKGEYQIEVKFKAGLQEKSEEFMGALLRTRLECLRADKHSEQDGVSTFVFAGVSKGYAEEAQKRLQDAGASVKISATPAEKSD